MDETRVSAIIIMAFIGFGYSLFSHYNTGDITGNLLDLVKVLVYGIVGVNGVKYVSDAFQGRREENNNNHYNSGDGY